MKIPLSQVFIDETIKQRILATVDSQNYILGKECEAFEQELAAYTGVKHCVLSSSWTAAVHLLLLALKVKAGDEILDRQLLVSNRVAQEAIHQTRMEIAEYIQYHLPRAMQKEFEDGRYLTPVNYAVAQPESKANRLSEAKQ